MSPLQRWATDLPLCGAVLAPGDAVGPACTIAGTGSWATMPRRARSPSSPRVGRPSLRRDGSGRRAHRPPRAAAMESASMGSPHPFLPASPSPTHAASPPLPPRRPPDPELGISVGSNPAAPSGAGIRGGRGRLGTRAMATHERKTIDLEQGGGSRRCQQKWKLPYPRAALSWLHGGGGSAGVAGDEMTASTRRGSASSSTSSSPRGDYASSPPCLTRQSFKPLLDF